MKSLFKIVALIVFFLIGWKGVMFSQRIERINDLELQLKTETAHDKLVDIYYELAAIYKSTSPQKAKEYAEKSLTISKSIKYTKGEVRALNQLGELERNFANYERALELHYSALRINEERADQKGIAGSYIYISKVYQEKGEYDLSGEFLENAMDIAKKIRNLTIQSKVNLAFAELENVKGKSYLALQYALLAVENIETTNDDFHKAIAYQRVGDLYKKTKQLDKSLDSYKRSLKLFEEIEYKERQAILSFEIGEIYQLGKQYDQALVYMKNSLGLAEETGLKAYIKKGYENLANVYERNGDYEHAYEYLKYFDAIKDAREISELESKLELERKNQELELLKKESEFRAVQLENEAKSKQWAIVAAGIVLILSLIALIALRQKNSLNHKLQLANEQAKKSKMEKEEFFAFTSHEIRTPLNAVVGMTKLLSETHLNPSQQQYLRTIKSSAQNILFLVNDVLDLSKIEKGAIELESIDLSLHDIVNDIIHGLSFKIREKDVELVAEISEDVPEVVKGDPVRINQILLNLADNALKFTETGYVKIIIKKVQDDNQTDLLRFEVEDTGIGIRQSRLESIFDTYKQETKHTTRHYGGTGLGLAITKQLIKLMGGDINVTSQFGKGSVFWFEIELKKSKRTKHQLIVTDKKVKLKDLKILVVDDNPLNREVFFDLINDYKNNVEVDMADDGKMALAKIQSNDYDVVLMDIQMPRMDGYEATRQIRKLSGSKSKLPVIAMTAHVLEGVADKCDAAGMNDYVAKPINMKVLTQKISHYINKLEKNKSDDLATEQELEASVNNTDKILQEADVVNLLELYELVGKKDDKLIKYIDIYLKQVPVDLEKLKESFESQDWENLAKLAHKIKGNVGYMGIKSIKEDLIALEKQKKEVGNIDEISDLVAKIEEVIEKSIVSLRKVKSKLIIE